MQGEDLRFGFVKLELEDGVSERGVSVIPVPGTSDVLSKANRNARVLFLVLNGTWLSQSFYALARGLFG